MTSCSSAPLIQIGSGGAGRDNMPRQTFRTDIWHHKGVAAFTLIRGLAAVSIIINPVWGFIASIILDILDGRFLLVFGHLDKLVYDLWDKVLDSVTFLAELTVVAPTSLGSMFWALFFYRMAGQVLFWITKRPRILVFFPNFFESAFLWFFVPASLYSRWMSPTGALILLFEVKFAHEVILHWIWPTYWVKPWNTLMHRIFGQGKLLARFFSSTYPPGYGRL